MMIEGTINIRWLVVLMLQLVVGGGLLYFGEHELGIGLIGAAMGQLHSAQSVAVMPSSPPPPA